jgi:hypothetical protein
MCENRTTCCACLLLLLVLRILNGSEVKTLSSDSLVHGQDMKRSGFEMAASII